MDEFNKKAHDGLYVYQTTSIETAHDYKYGGYHAVDVGDMIEGRFQALRKLGHGHFATVWLARDTQASRFVALKIITGKTTRKLEKSPVFQEISDTLRVTEGADKFLVPEVDEPFSIKGTNGHHLVLIEQVMGPSVDVLWQCLLDNRIVDQMMAARIGLARTITKQVLQGLDFLHTHGLVHGNIDMSNMVLELDEKKLAAAVKAGQNEKGESVEKIDKSVMQDMTDPDTVKEASTKHPQKGAPAIIVADQPLYKLVAVDKKGNLKVRICDTNSSFEAQNPCDDVYASIHLRAPEVILKQPLDSKVDIWTLGCVLFEMVTGHRLFEITRSKHKEVDDEHLVEMNGIVGPLPLQMFDQWKPTSAFAKFLGPNGQVTPPQDYKMVALPMEVKFDEARPEVMEDEEAMAVKQLIRSMLNYEPAQRPSARELLQHKWLQ